MGKALGGGGGKKAKPAQPYAGAQFQPYSYTNVLGTTSGAKEGQYGYNTTTQINPELTNIAQTALPYPAPFISNFSQLAGQQLPMFGYGDNGEQRAADIFNQQSALLQPQFDQQRQQLSNDLFGSGRLGLMLSGETAGAGDVGMVQPDAYGLGRAQSQTLANLSGKSREQAMLEQQQGYQQALQSFVTNEAQRKQQLANYLGGYQGSLGAFGDIADMEMALVNQGLNIEQARAAAQSASAQGGAALANAGQKATSGGGGLFSGLLQSAASSILSPSLDAAGKGILNMFSGGGGLPTGQSPNSSGLTGQSTNADWENSLNFLGGGS